MTAVHGHLRKMAAHLAGAAIPVEYALSLDSGDTSLNPMLGQTVRLKFTGRITCKHCGTATNKSFAQGYCYACFKRLAECDLCVVSPDRCHFAAGTCRDPAWGERVCMDTHIVYLANSSGIKVGITKPLNTPTRWIDQGAVQGLPIARVATRHQAGLLEVALSRHFTDKTQWQRMLMADDPLVDMGRFRDQAATAVSADLELLTARFGPSSIEWLVEAEETVVRYPVRSYPTRVKSLDPRKQPNIKGRLMGIKGQYLMFDTGVLNLRRYIGYEVHVTLGD